MNQRYEPNWWQRNWKWFVPVGCLSALLLFAGGIALLVTFVFGMMKSSDVYGQAVARAKANPELIATLGSPIVEGYFTSGSIQQSGASGSAELSIPLTGPKGKATIYVEARKSAGEWSFGKLQAEIESSHQRIDLRTGAERSTEPSELPDGTEQGDSSSDDLGQTSSI
jgi:hypothetical protein